MAPDIDEAAVDVLASSGDDGIELESAIEQVQEKTGCDFDQARVNLLIVSKQQHGENGTRLFLSDDYNAEEFLESSGPTAGSTGGDGTAGGESVPQDTGAAVPAHDPDSLDPDDWDSESFDLDDLQSLPPAPSPMNETWNHQRVLADVGHPLVPDEREFLDQEHRDGVTEMEWFSFLVNDTSFGVMIEGEPGTAKGTMVKSAAAEANQPLVRINMGVSITKEKLVGGYVPTDDANEELLVEAKDMADGNPELTVGKALDLLGAKEQFEWRDGLFTLAFRRGWWILVDEINAAEPETLMPFFGALEQGDDASLELTECSESISPHPNFRFVATMNPPHHEGTYRLNDALKDRSHHMQKSYLPVEKEAGLVQSMSDEPIPKDDARKICRMANQIRSEYPEEVDQTLTPRGCKRIAEYTSLLSLEEAAKEEMLSRTVYEDSYNAIERAIEQTL